MSDNVYESFSNPYTQLSNIVELNYKTTFISFITSLSLNIYTQVISDIEQSTEKISYKQTWLDTTVFLSDFENNLESGNVDINISGWRLKRKASDSDLYITLDNMLSTENTYVDTTPRNNIEYTYALFSFDSNGNESLGIEGTSTVIFDSWILSDDSSFYIFFSGWDGFQSDSIETNKDNYVYENYTKYPIISFGLRNYKKSSIKTIPLQYNSTSFNYDLDVNILNELESFINNGEIKSLRNPAGEIIRIVCSNFSYDYEDKIGSHPYEITFNWVEVEEAVL
jgi:hypothetical protein